MNEMLKRQHQIDMKNNDIYHFLHLDPPDVEAAIARSVHVKELLEYPIMNAQQYG